MLCPALQQRCGKFQNYGSHNPTWAKVCELLLERMGRCSYSTAFSGLDAPGVAIGMLRETAKAFWCELTVDRTL